jgi:uncharacterized protein (TIGR02118 family)
LQFPLPLAIFACKPMCRNKMRCEVMTILYALFRKPEEPESFDRHFQESLVPLLQKVPGLRGLQLTRINGAALGESKYHVVSQLSFDNRRAMDEALSSKEGKTVVRDIMSFAPDLVTVFFGEQII